MEKENNSDADKKDAQLEIERKKLKLEFEKLRVERLKAWATAISIAVPIIVVAATIGFGYWTEKQRADTNFQIEQHRADIDFKIKAAEIITKFQNPYEMKGRARILRSIFPDELGDKFGENFKEEQFTVPIPPDETILLRLLIERPQQRQEIINIWKQIYPMDKRVNNLQPNQ